MDHRNSRAHRYKHSRRRIRTPRGLDRPFLAGALALYPVSPERNAGSQVPLLPAQVSSVAVPIHTSEE